MTALAGMALLSEGSTTTQGKYCQEHPPGRRLPALAQPRQRPDRRSRRATTATPTATASRCCSSRRCSARKKTQSRRKELIDVLTRAVVFTGQAQTAAGGWGYVSAKDGSDFDEGSTTITQVQGLRGCRNAGIAVPKEIIDKAVNYIRKCTLPDGGVQYSSKGGGGRPAITAAAIACLFNAGDYDSQYVPKLLDYCQQQPGRHLEPGLRPLALRPLLLCPGPVPRRGQGMGRLPRQGLQQAGRRGHRKRQVRRLEPRLHRPDLYHRHQPDHPATRQRRAADLPTLTCERRRRRPPWRSVRMASRSRTRPLPTNSKSCSNRQREDHPPDDRPHAQRSRFGRHRPAGRRPRENHRATGPGDRRPGPGHRGTADLAVQPRPLPVGRRAGAGQDADDQHAGADAEPVVQPHPVHARPDAGRHHRHRHHRGEPHDRQPRVPLSRRAAVLQRDPGRRNQPHAAQDAGGAAGSHARAAGHRGPRAAQAVRSVLRAGHAEPDRAGRHLSAARGAAGPLHVQGVRALSELQRGVRDRPAHDDHAGRPRRAGAHGRGDSRPAADRPRGAGHRPRDPLRAVAGAADARRRGGRARLRRTTSSAGAPGRGPCSS